MKVKDLYKEYKGYEIVLYGKNSYYSLIDCIKNSTPFSYIKTTNPREIDEMNVIDVVVKEESFDTLEFDPRMKYKGKINHKGIVYALVEKGE